MKAAFLSFAFLCAIVQGAWGWDGSGTSAAPYLIKTSADWKQLSDEVSGGNSYSGKYFEMTADIDAQGLSVGSASRPFSGTLNGGLHTLTYNRGTMDATNGVQPVADYCAPFVLLEGATIRHLRVTGAVYSSHMHAAGIASLIGGTETTTIDDCHVSSRLVATYDLNSDASFGGITGEVLATCTATTEVTNCSFTGRLLGRATSSSGIVGFTSKPVKMEYCIFDPQELSDISGTPATFARTAPGVACVLKDCYYTKVLGTPQGKGLFTEVTVPEGCTVEMVSQPVMKLNGKDYYTAGSQVRLTVPEGTAFDHWVASSTSVGCFISDPWTAGGIHTLTDVRSQPVLTIATSMPEPVQKNRSRHGIIYRYLSNRDYLLFMSDSLRQARNYQFDSDGECFVYDGEGTKTYITVVWGCDPSDGTFQNFYREGWFFQAKNYEGCIIDNDLVATAWDHTHLFAIAPRAFKDVKELKRIIFLSNIDPGLFKSHATIGLDVAIQEQAFMGSGIEELVMMYRNQKSKSWDILSPASGVTVAANAFEGTSCQIAVDPSVYQSYLGDKSWRAHQSRIGIYAAKVEDMSVNGAVYSYWRNTRGEALRNSSDNHTTMMETLRHWNADYQEFTATSLLSTSAENIWYTQVVGVDKGSLDKGTMRIYNDPGSLYNYKTIALQSLGGSKDVTAIEFWQTNGRSENSLSDLKMVIRNGALKGCTNLRELRMFYHVQDGDDHWEVLGPTDVIPGDNIFGKPSISDMKGMSAEEQERKIRETVPEDFKILVAPDRYQEFLGDLNWQPYLKYIEPVEFNPNNSNMSDFELGGLIYSYMTSPGGIMQTSQTVSQDVSWWTAPRIAAELLIYVATIGNSTYSDVSTIVELSRQSSTLNSIGIGNDFTITEVINRFYSAEAPLFASQLDDLVDIQLLQNYGLLTEEGFWVSRGAALEAVSAISPLEAIDLSNTISGIATRLHADIAYTLLPRAWRSFFSNATLYGVVTGAATTATYYSSLCWGGTGSYNGDLLQKGMKANILSNIHQVGLVGGGYVITTPQKNLCYHTYIKDVPASTTDAVIYAGTGKKQGRNNNARTMTMSRSAFRNHTSLKHIGFHETGVQSDEAMPMLFVIPDSAFVGCTNLEHIDLRVTTEGNGLQALGPENFVLGGDSVFAGLDPAKFHIIIDPKRKQHFLDNDSWKPLAKYFVYMDATPDTQYQEYGGNYAYAYENGTTQKVHKVGGHKIEHTLVTGADDKFLAGHQGALKLCNDIGVYNNYQLDAVTTKAFMGNQNLRVVNFTDLMGSGAYGDSYTDLQMALMDSCFANCKNLKNIDMLYLVTDDDNHIDPIKPGQVTIGQGVLDGTSAKIKMMPQQVAWFEADTTWNKYRDRFMACIIKPGDKGIRKALKPMAYYDMANMGYDPTTWDDYIDLARIAGAGFAWLDGKFREQGDDILSFADFRHFESVGLDYVGKEWFRGCRNMSNILLPSTIKRIEDHAFTNCGKLQEIELPAALNEIASDAFADCHSLKTVRALGTTPATLTGSRQFQKGEGLRIYVPAAAVDAYKAAWPEYRDYIVSDASYIINKVVAVTEPGTLADKLELNVEWSNSGVVAGDEPRYIHGNYSKYDSLTVSGPLNDLDLWVIRYLAGTESYEREHGATDGQLRYLNLYNAHIKKDENCKAHYLNAAERTGYIGWRETLEDDVLPELLFMNCTSLETVILPKSLKKITSGIFIDCNALRRVAITGAVKEYAPWERAYTMLTKPIDELVFVTDDVATSTSNDPWTQPIGVTFTKKSQLPDYLSQPYLTSLTQNVMAPFEDDAVMETLAQKGQFFPSEYLEAESAENLFNDNTAIKAFDEFRLFSVRSLDRTFANASGLEQISLPDSLEAIGAEAFSGCTRLGTIRIAADSVPQLAAGAFASLPGDFRILVTKDLAARYREKWAEYADHISVDESNYSDSEWTVVMLDKPNTLAEKLGFEVKWDYRSMTSDRHNYIAGVRGDYSRIHRLKVSGPISGSDFALMRYLAGFCPWTNTRNAMGQLEAIDLYDAEIKASDDIAAPDMFKVITQQGDSYVANDNELPSYAFLQAYNLKSLILPKTCTKIYTRALQQCEALETLVLGDDLVDFDWSALDDDVMLTRLYILAKKKPAMTQDAWLIRQMHNNYNPTLDAFYVRPSLYDEYLNDRAYTYDLRRTNLISKGVFDDDDSFCAFARHAAATQDDLWGITDVDGWFDDYAGAKNLTQLRYTSIDSLKAATMAPLTQLESIVMPATLESVEEGLFKNNPKLRYADFLQCDSTNVVASLRNGGLARLAIDTQQTLAYVPATYGETTETNVIVSSGSPAGGSTLRTKTYRMVDSLDYVVPYRFEAEKIENPRTLAASSIPYTLCVPYKMNVPQYARAYKLSTRDGNSLVFEEVTGELEAMVPYLLKVVGNKRYRKMSTTLDTDIAQTIPASGPTTYGRQVDAPGYSIRGSFVGISNAEAAAMGAYVLQTDGDWHPVTTAQSQVALRPFRAFLLPSARNASTRIGMSLVDSPSGDATDGIDTIETIDQDGKHRYYDLNGHELPGKPSRAGVYIYNGNKVAIKRE